MRRIVLFAFVVASSAAFAEARGPGIGDVMRARAYSMGGAFRSLGGGTEVVDGNPAALGVYKRYVIELSGAWDPRNPFGFGALSVMDSVTSPMAAGLAYQLVSVGAGDQARVAHLNTAAFSIPFGNVFHVGVSMRHVLMTGARDANAITGDAGMLLNLSGLTFAVSGHNLVSIQNPDFPRYFAGAVGFISQSFSLAADVRADFNDPIPKWAFSAGGEYVFGRVFPVRAGYSHDLIRDARTIGAGVGLYIDTGSVDISYSHELGGSYSRLIALTLRMQVGVQ